MNLQAVGDGAWLLETRDAQEAQRWRMTLVHEDLTGILELIPGFRSLLVSFDPLIADADGLRRQLERLADLPLAPLQTRRHEFGVHYEGEDLAIVAKAANLTPQDVVDLHTAKVYTVAFLGFAPGFAYLTGLDAALRLPRRASPRTRVPAGSVAVADGFTGIYPQATPGGWHILGHSDANLFDVAWEPPAVLAPGDQVCFRALS